MATRRAGPGRASRAPAGAPSRSASPTGPRGRPSGLVHLFEPLMARSTQKNLDQGFCAFEAGSGNRQRFLNQGALGSGGLAAPRSRFRLRFADAFLEARGRHHGCCFPIEDRASPLGCGRRLPGTGNSRRRPSDDWPHSPRMRERVLGESSFPVSSNAVVSDVGARGSLTTSGHLGARAARPRALSVSPRPGPGRDHRGTAAR